MRRVASRFRLRPGSRDEYRRRHDALWPEMAAAMRAAGIRNYTIWNDGDELFGYYEVEDYERSLRVLNASDVVRRWNDGMRDLISYETDPDTGRMREMSCVFLFEG